MGSGADIPTGIGVDVHMKTGFGYRLMCSDYELDVGYVDRGNGGCTEKEFWRWFDTYCQTRKKELD